MSYLQRTKWRMVYHKKKSDDEFIKKHRQYSLNYYHRKKNEEPKETPATSGKIIFHTNPKNVKMSKLG